MRRLTVAVVFLSFVFSGVGVTNALAAKKAGDGAAKTKELEHQVDSLEASLKKEKSKNSDQEERIKTLEDDDGGLEDNVWALLTVIVGIFAAVLRAVWYGATATVVPMGPTDGGT